MLGRCACGTVRVELARRPDYINQCDCSACLRLGAAWGYFEPREVTITGATAKFTRSKADEPRFAFHFCPACGSTVNWTGLGQDPPRMGVNMRLFEPDDLEGFEVRFSDGLRRFGDERPPPRHAPITIARRWPT